MSIACLLLGTNVGDRSAQLERARNTLNEAGTILKASAVYQTQPWGLEKQPEFYNQAVLLETTLAPEQLLTFLKASELRLGRVPGEPWGPRLIDMDILFMDNLEIQSAEMTIPHPRVRERRFALVPLNEIASDWIDPVSGLTVARLTEACTDPLEVSRL